MTDSDSDDDCMPCLITNGNGTPEDDHVKLPTNSNVEYEADIGEEMYVSSLAPTKDLFSSLTFPTAEECMEHMAAVHGIDMGLLSRRLDMDTFSFIRFVNYVRSECPSPGFVMSLSSDQKWADPEFMKPAIQDDPLLMYDFEQSLNPMEDEEEAGIEIDISRDLDDQIANPRNLVNQSSSESVSEIEHTISVPVDKFNEMKQQFEQLTMELAKKDDQLRKAMEDMTRMRDTAKELFCLDGGASASSISKKRGSSETIPVAEAMTVEEDFQYFNSYAHYSIHHEMLSDKARTLAYRKAILENKDKISGSRVLDLGCGTGILSMFSAEGGASQVVGVDCSDILYQAMDIVRENSLEDKVRLVKGRLEDIELPVKQFDIIVSEWMGYFLLFEGMLDSVLSARDKYLAPGGIILPNRCTISLALMSDISTYASLVDFWDDVYGYKMTCMRDPILGEANVQIIENSSIASNEAKVLELDLNSCSVSDTEFESPFSFTISRPCNLTAVVGWFDTFFDLPNPVLLSTSPKCAPTHWKQTVFYLPEKISVEEGQQISGKIICKRMVSDARALKVSLTLGERTYRYTVD